jgi:serine/threonine protein kinase
LEICDATVENYCRGEYKGKVPSDRSALFQMADGLDHIHSKGFAHRDISSNNVLIKLTGVEAVMKISDFGVCKPASETKSFSMSGDGVKGTIPFLAPELLRQMLNVENHQDTNEGRSGVRGHISNDIFSLGCVFYRFLTKDGHPFMHGVVESSFNSISSQIISNILENKQYLERKFMY